MREMLGKSGNSMVVVSVYLPTKSGSQQQGGGAWDWQMQQMARLRAKLQHDEVKGCIEAQGRRTLAHLKQVGTLEVGGVGGGATPISLALHDIEADLYKMKAKYEVITYLSGENKSWIDYFLVSKEMEERRLGGRLATRGRQLEGRNEQLQTCRPPTNAC